LIAHGIDGHLGVIAPKHAILEVKKEQGPKTRKRMEVALVKVELLNPKLVLKRDVGVHPTSLHATMKNANH
jgi:hypothetical protein